MRSRILLLYCAILTFLAGVASAQTCPEVDASNLILGGNAADCFVNYLNLTVAANASGGILGEFPGTLGSPGQVLTTDGSGHWTWTTGAVGTVTSVNVSGGTTGLTTSGGPITTSGTITLAGTLVIANGGTNSSTALSGSSIMISNGTSIIQGAAGTTTTLLHGNAAGAPTYSAVSLTADVTGTLPISHGGTGSTVRTWPLLAPVNSSDNVITPTADIIPFAIDNGNATYTNNLQEWRNNGIAKASIGSDGSFEGNQIISDNNAGFKIWSTGGVASFITLENGATSRTNSYYLPDADGTVALVGTGGGLLTAGSGITIGNTGGVTTITASTPTGFVKTNPAASSDNEVTGSTSIIPLSPKIDNIATTISTGVHLKNTTAATNGTRVQYSPMAEFSGSAWQTTGSAAHAWDWGIENEPVNGTADSKANLSFQWQKDGGGWESGMTLHAVSPGVVTLGLVCDPINPLDAATKQYVDAQISGAGTVTSIDVSGGTTGLTTSGGPVTTSGTITLAGTLAIPNGGTGSAISSTTAGKLLIANSTSAFTEGSIAIAGNMSYSYNSGTNTITLQNTDDGSVPFGGTGRNSLTAYSVLCGGTTSTNAIQSVASLGTAGQVLTSNGAGALPTWQASASGVTSVSDDGGATLTISPTTGNVLAGINLAHANIWTALQTGNANGIATTNTYRFALTNTTASTALVPNQQSPSLKIISHGWNAADVTNTWNIYSAGGADASGNRENISFELDQGSGYTSEAKIYYDGAVSARNRFLLNGATPTAGHYLRSDGTGYLDGTIQAGDLPSLSGSYIQNQTSSQSSASFNITNNVATTAQATTTYTAGTATALTLTATTSNASHPNQGLTFNVSNAGGGGTATDVVGTSTNWLVTSAGDATLNSATLTSPLTAANGGTGLATLTAHDVLVGNGTSAVTPVSPSTAGKVLTSNGTGSDPSFQAIPTVLTAIAIYGDASDGDVAFDGTNTFAFASLAGSTYTITRSFYAHNITTTNSVTIKTNGFPVFATGTVTNGSGSTFHCNGVNATVGLGGGGAASNAAASTMLPPGLAGKNGPSTISAGVNGATATLSYGGSGGAGGADGVGHNGGTAGTATAPGAAVGSIHAFPMMYYGGAFNNSGLVWWQAGGGGASGGNSTAGASIAGNGGGGAGTVAIYAQTIVNSGTISANGGNGSTSAQPGTGGGGGGGGGHVLLVTNSFSGTTPTVTGGTHGNGTGGGANGSDGNSGTYTLILNQ